MDTLSGIITGFEPTYEELKHNLVLFHTSRKGSFEPTYEELKLHSFAFVSSPELGFEPTYEELKQI